MVFLWLYVPEICHMANWFTRIFLGEKEQRSSYPAGSVSAADFDAWVKFFGLDAVTVSDISSLGLPALYRCVNLIAGSIAMLPFQVMQQDGQNRQVASDHPLSYLIGQRPHPLMTSFEFIRTFLTLALIHGNAVCAIRRGAANRPDQLKIFKPKDCQIIETLDGELFYNTPFGVLRSEDVIHIKALSLDGLIGLSPIGLSQKSLKVSLYTQEFLNKYYQNGTMTAGYLTTPERLNATQADDMQNRWDSKYSGVHNAGKTPVLYGGTDYKTITQTMQQGQFYEIMSRGDVAICQIYGVPLHMIGEMSKQTSFGTGIESQNLAFVQQTLMPWIKQIEQEFNYKLFRVSERGKYYTRINLNALLRADFKTRMEAYHLSLQDGLYSLNEIRRLEDANDFEGGDVHLINSTLIPLDEAGRVQKQPTTTP
jgi:HK97 family phage portal protein